MAVPRVLISTISARTGGVPVMVRFAIRVLRDLGAEPVIAYYEPYSMNPALSVPAFALGRRRPGAVLAEPLDGCETHAIGAWLPELEFTTYRLNKHWRDVIDACQAHVAVSGNVLAALPLAMRGVPHLAWIASDWHGDRVDRVRQFGVPRRLLDALLVRPVMRHFERRLLGGDVLALSEYTSKRVARVTGHTAPGVCPTPVDVALFKPAVVSDSARTGHIVFSGRVDDARKNLDLLLSAVASLRQRGRTVRLTVCGGSLSARLSTVLDRLRLGDTVSVLPYLDHARLADLLGQADVFALPSHQEGLCIAALEAMACGLPVISTRCGGPEEFVMPGVNGELVGFSALEMANAIERVVTDRTLRSRYSQAARETVEARYSEPVAAAALRAHLQRVYPSVFAG